MSDPKADQAELVSALRGFAEIDAASIREDSWGNRTTGAGISDKASQNGFFGADCVLSDGQIAAMFTFEDLSAKICDVYPREAMREGFELGGFGEDEDKLCDYLDPFELVQTCTDAWIWGRTFGGSAAWPLTNDGDKPDQPLTKPYSRVEGIEVFDRRWLIPAAYDKRGRHLLYNVIQPGQRERIGQLHASRVITFPGARTEHLAKSGSLMGWDYSVLQRPYQALKSEGSVWGSVENLIQEASVSVFKLKGLFTLASSGNRDATLQRYGVINRLKSLYNAIVLDADKEDFVTHAQTFAGVADLSDRAMKRVAAAAEMPVTVLMGEAPAGLNATGDSDLRWFLARVKSERALILEPRLKRLIMVLLAATESPVKLALGQRPEIVWPDLWQATEAERADMYLKSCQGDAILVDKQIALPEEIFAARAKEQGWSSGPLTFSDESRALRDEALKEATLPTEPEPEPPADPNAPPVSADPNTPPPPPEPEAE